MTQDTRRIHVTQEPTATVIAEAVKVLESGGLILFPTETTYGAGVDAMNPAAVEKLLRYKSRREGKPLSIAVTDQAMAEQYVELSDSARRTYQRFLPGPVTVVSRSKGVVAPGVASEYGTLGVRIPDYSLVVDIVRALGRPITATSANGSGEKRPYSIQDVFDGLSATQKSLIDLVLDAGQLPPNPPSTVIDTTLETPVIFRQGAVNAAGGETTAAGTAGAHANTLTLTSHSEKETVEIAQRLMLQQWAALKERGLLFLLSGSLGAGKTAFVKGIGTFLGIGETLSSPTYVYVQEYDFLRHGYQGVLHHLDLWRIEKPEVIDALQIPEMCAPGHVVAIEWPSVGRELLLALLAETPVQIVEIVIEDLGETSRRFLITTQPLGGGQSSGSEQP